MQMNRIEIAGFLGARPEVRYLPSGTKVANARLGESHRYKGSDNQAVTQTNWHNLTFYNSLADQAITFDKGTNLFVEGAVQQRKFTPKDGSERTVHEVIVQSCHVIANSVPTAANPNSGAMVSSSEDLDHEQAIDTWPL
jgi:single-strand DNA-binding protein